VLPPADGAECDSDGVPIEWGREWIFITIVQKSSGKNREKKRKQRESTSAGTDFLKVWANLGFGKV